MKSRRWLPWVLFGAVFWTVSGLLAWCLQSDARRKIFLPGATTHGHHQIELQCSECHTPMMGVKNDACNRCHAAELTAANDTHPLSKFQDPRNADRLKTIDALQCVTCHREHRPDETHPMGVTQPADYCFHCHQDIAKDRPSHQGLPFGSCATAGCHNYHDNTALYADFILKHTAEPDMLPRAQVRSAAPAPVAPAVIPLTGADRDPPAGLDVDQQIVYDWEQSAHARARVNCSDCHQDGHPNSAWVPRPDHQSCARCHEVENTGFLGGLHGMRLAAKLGPMTPALTQLPMHANAAAKTMDCNACHGSHRYDTRPAAASSCQSCHDDEHTRNYENSVHARLWRAEEIGAAPAGSGVSCATCHLPREIHREDGREVVRARHNQNANLRPNEKMIRTVCLDCHGYAFALDALADPALIRANFQGRPARHLDSVRMAVDRAAATKRQSLKPENHP